MNNGCTPPAAAFLIRYAAPAGVFACRSCISCFIVVPQAPHLHYSFFIILYSFYHCWVVTSTTWLAISLKAA